jgi:hypothetical protein
MQTGLIPAILANNIRGYWENDKTSMAKIFSTIWQVIMLASWVDAAIRKFTRRAISAQMPSEISGVQCSSRQTGAVHCAGNIGSPAGFGYRMTRGFEGMDWMARSVTGEGFDPGRKRHDHYIRSGISGQASHAARMIISPVRGVP